MGAHSARAPATLAGIALALHALGELAGRQVSAAELAFPEGGKPHLAGSSAHPAPDFSISHSGHWVGCAAVTHGLVGFDVELGPGERLSAWAAREAALKACGAGVAEAREVELLEHGAVCRGVTLHATLLDLFAGAAACAMTSVAIERLETRSLALTELFTHA